ncbi:MAG: ATP-binding cassette domain-containing protein [Rhodanobacter sp.]
MPSAQPSANEALPVDPDRSTAQRLLQARGLRFAVAGRLLWHDLDLTLAPGERLAIAGPSGSGKTLLLRTLAALEPIQSGEITFQGRPLADWSMPVYRAHVVYLPQRPALPEGKVEAALQAPFHFQVRQQLPFPAEQARELLQMLGRDATFLQQRTERLSGGEGQIVAMLRALLTAPAVLLLDEPTASLDAEAVAAIEKLIANWLQEKPERGCVWTSHDRQQLERNSDRVVSLGPSA